MKILILEDDANVCRTLVRRLSRRFPDATFKTTDSATEAINILRNSALEVQFRLIVSDFNVVGAQTGGDVLEWLRRHMSHLVPRFMFHSGNDRAQDLGVHFAVKPCDEREFFEVVQKVLAQ